MDKNEYKKPEKISEDMTVIYEVKDARYISVGTYLLDVRFKTEIVDRKSSSNKVFGNFFAASYGDTFESTGAFYKTRFGVTFYPKETKRILPSRGKDIATFLRKKIYGLGEKTASHIVNSFGNNAIEIINREGKQKLIEIGVPEKKAEMIEGQLRKFLRIEETMLYLVSKGLHREEAFNLYLKYEDSTITMAKANPYSFVETIGFKKAEMVAMNSGFPLNSMERASGLLAFYLKQDISNGHMYSLKEELREKFKNEGVGNDTFEASVLALSRSSRLKEVGNMLFLKESLNNENLISKEISNKLKSAKKAYISSADTNDFILEFEKNNSISFSSEQSEAIRVFARSSIFILTGGPGTGKTQTAKAIVDLVKSKGYSIALACPTGKASARLSQVVGQESVTIHKKLEMKPFKQGALKEIQEDVVLIDEVSMVGSFLFYELLKSIPDETKIVFIGDVDQIPSVEAGNILESLIESNVIPTVKLKKVFRQAEGSKIITNAHKIKNSDISLEYGNDFLMYKTTNDQETMDQILDIYEELLNKGYKTEDIAVLSPSKRTSIGTEELNFQIQRKFNKAKDYILLPNGTKYALEDRVMQIRNNYMDWVCNGHLGYVCQIKENSVEIYFENGYVVEYNTSQINENIIHAYSSTIHKYQGSEVKVVIVPLSLADKKMWNKNLFYTALTRAKELFIMVGQEDVFKSYCMTNPEKRRTTLVNSIKEAI